MSFPTTRWTLVARAKSDDEAVNELLAAYWQPLYILARLERCSPADAHDVVQSFSIHILEKRLFSAADPARGRLRAFLKTAFKHFLSDERAREQAKKRGGGALRIDVEAAEAVLRDLGPDPEQAFARAWARVVFERSLARLQAETDRFTVVQRYFNGDLPALEVVAKEQRMTVPALKSFLHRARARYRELLAEESDEDASELAALL